MTTPPSVTPQDRPEREELARNIHEGMEVWDDEQESWVGVVSALHILAPFPVSSLQLADGHEWSMHPSDRFMCRRTAQDPGGSR